MTKAEIIQFISQGYDNSLKFQVEHNPTAVYQEIKRRYGNEFPNYAKGLEQFEYQKGKMLEFLVQKAKRSVNPMQFATEFGTHIPYNTKATNWTKH